jgi:hypothetical protein
MEKPHPNLLLLERLDIRNIDACKDLFDDSFVFHYFNPNLPDLEGDYVGVEGLKNFFSTLGEMTSGSFEVLPVSATPVGDELVVVQTRNKLTLDQQPIAIDVVVVWRAVDGKFREAWDIPSAYSLAEENAVSVTD